MGRTLVPRYLAALELGTLADPKLHELAGKIATAAKTSTLVAGNATLTTTVAELATCDSSLTVSNQTVVADKTKLSTDLATEAQNRSLVVGALRTIVTVSTNIEAEVDELYPLYLQTYNRSGMHFEKLTPEFLVRLGLSMPDKVRYFVWRQNGRPIAFSVCTIDGDTICDEYIGLDYQSSISSSLYHYTFRDIVTWAIENGLKTYASTGLCYDPKLHLRQELVPLDLYVRQRRGVNIEYVQEGSIRNLSLVAERDPLVKKQRFDELRRIHRDPRRAKEYLLRSSMIASVRVSVVLSMARILRNCSSAES